MTSKKSRVFVCATFPKNLDLDSFKELEYTEISEITNLPNEPAPFLLCPICDTILVYKVGNYPIFYYHCSECSVNYKIEVNNKEPKKMYKCPVCNAAIKNSMFCVKCCSKWTIKPAIEESKNDFISWGNNKEIEWSDIDSITNLPKSSKQLAEEHWEYIEALLKAHEEEYNIKQIEFHYKSAFIHGYKHAMEDK